MSEPLQGPEATLRRMLHEAAEQVEPADGMHRIQARTRHRRPMPLPIAWTDIALTRLSLRLPDGFWVAWDRVAREVRAVSEHFLPAPARGGSGRGDRLRLGWLRPVAAMSTAVFIVAAVVYMAVEVPQVISPTGSTTHSAPPGSPHSGNGGTGGAVGPTPLGSASAHASSGSQSTSPHSTKSCSPPSPVPVITSPATSTTTPTQSQSPTPTATATPSATPTPTGSASSAAAGSADKASSAPATGASAGAATGNRAAHTLAARTKASTAAPHTTASPCASAHPRKKKKGPVASGKVVPAAAGALVLRAPGYSGPAADVRGKVG